ncbi:MAG: signal peptidase II [Bryobacterales bacterium]|nr:signal peptidase II [Bryobacterales bacterium]MDE0264075.1 signal peptidase II [Bryobacterales bacterium]MDE0620739.1 signal peptidase II [Bryobacterales bacterium]
MDESTAAGRRGACCAALTRSNLALSALGCSILGLDLYTKAVVSDALAHGESVAVLEGFFNLVHVRNVGIAFGLFADAPSWFRDWALPALALAGVVVVLALFRQTGQASALNRCALPLILAGAAGNLYERWLEGYVTDFLDFFVGAYHWPAFNVADSAITVGVGLLLLDSFRRPGRASARQGQTPS